MAIIQALLVGLGHAAGKILVTVFGWATALLFGHVTEQKRLLMSVATFGSLIWLCAVIGIIFPQAGVFLIAAFVPPAVTRHENLVRIGMLIAGIAIPFIVGVTLVVGEKNRKRSPGQLFRELLAGWPYTIGLALTLVLMIVFAPIMQLRMIVKRWSTEHIPVLVPAKDYLPSVGDIESVLTRAGIQCRRQHATWMLTFPTKVLTFFAGKQVQEMVADQLSVLVGPDFEVLLHPSDLVISGPKETIYKLQKILAEHLLFSHLYLTWDSKANELEKEMKQLWIGLINGGNPDRVWAGLAHLQARLNELDLEYSEWSVLFREKLQIEHKLLETYMNRQMRRAS